MAEDSEINYRYLRSDTFARPFPALLYLCDAANAIEGKTGVVYRKKITRRLNEAIYLINSLRCIENKGLRMEAIRAIQRCRAGTKTALPAPLETLVLNVVTAMIRTEERARNF